MPSPILIEFKTDISQLDKAVDALEELGMVDKQTAQSFRNTSKAARDYALEMEKAGKKVDSVTIDVKDFADALKKLPEKIISDQAKKSLEDTGKLTGELSGKTQMLTTRLRAMKQELTLLEAAGKGNTSEYQKLAAAAGRLEKQLNNTSQVVNHLSSETRALDVILSVSTGIAGGFAVAQGAAALFGDESEDLQKALLKVQAALSIVNGLQAISATLNQTSAASVEANSAAQKIYNYFVDQTTGKLIAMRVATAGFISLGVAAVVIAAVYAFRKWNEAAKEANAEAARLKAVNEAAVDIYSEQAAELTALVRIVRDENSTNQSKAAVLKTVNDKYGEQIGHFKNIEDLEKRFIARAEAYIEVLKLRAKAQAAMSLATEEYKKQIQAENDKSEEQVEVVKDVTTWWGKAVAVITQGKSVMGDLQAIKNQDKAIADSNENFTKYIDLFNQFTTEANNLTEKWSFDKKVAETTKQINMLRDSILAMGPFGVKEIAEAVIPLVDEVKEKVPEIVGITDEMFAQLRGASDVTKEKVLKDLEEWAQAYKDSAGDVMMIADATFTGIANLSQTALNNELQNLQDQLDQKKISQDQYEKAVREAKIKEARREKLLAVFKALIDVPAAVIAAGVITPQAIATAIAGGLELANILAQQIPAFAEGTKSVKGGKPGKDSVLSLLMPGERVVTTAVNREYTPILDAIHDRKIPAPFLNALTGVGIPNFNLNLGAGNNGPGAGIDYDKLGEVISKKSSQKNVHVNVDKNGLETWVEEAGNKTRYLNNKFRQSE